MKIPLSTPTYKYSISPLHRLVLGSKVCFGVKTINTFRCTLYTLYMKLPWISPRKQEIPTSLGKLFVRKTSNVVVLNNVLSIPRSLVEQLSFFTFLVVLGRRRFFKNTKIKVFAYNKLL